MTAFRVYADWNADGDFADAREEITGRVLDGRTPLTMQYGHDQSRSLSPIAPGEARFAVNNLSRDYSPENTASPLAGQVVPGRKVWVTATLTGTTYTMLRAQIEDFDVLPDWDSRYLSVSCIDPLGALRGAMVSTGLYRGLRTGEAVNLLLDAVGWPVTMRDVEVGATVMPYWWLDREDAFEALMDLVYSEGPPALVTVDSSGRIVFRSRHHRLQRAASTTAQSTWRASGARPHISSPATYNHGFKEIINSVTFEMPMRQVAGVISDVWTSQGLISVAAGETLAIIAQASDPFVGALVPEVGTDFTLMSGSVTVTLARTSGLSTTIFVQASSGGPAVLADLKLRGYAVTTVTTVQIQAQDTASIGKYGPQSLPDVRTPKWASPGDARAIASIVLGQRGERLATISVSMRAGTAVEQRQQLTRDLSDRVRVIEPHTGLDADCFVEQIAHSVSQGGAEHVTTFGLEKIPTQITGAFILGSGVLGTNRLGRRGFTETSSMFVLGSVTNGVLGTSILVP